MHTAERGDAPRLHTSLGTAPQCHLGPCHVLAGFALPTQQPWDSAHPQHCLVRAEEEGMGQGGQSPQTTAVGPKLPSEGLGVRRQLRTRPLAAAATCRL